uniref:Uncharacterized protein n=1 Tax=Mycena chlorophos TaxID=658473 RepID=A0ABQ0LP90_MYCCL|nr:predicted protein [Mycena chlorophos]
MSHRRTTKGKTMISPVHLPAVCLDSGANDEDNPSSLFDDDEALLVRRHHARSASSSSRGMSVPATDDKNAEEDEEDQDVSDEEGLGRGRQRERSQSSEIDKPPLHKTAASKSHSRGPPKKVRTVHVLCASLTYVQSVRQVNAEKEMPHVRRLSRAVPVAKPRKGATQAVNESTFHSMAQFVYRAGKDPLLESQTPQWVGVINDGQVGLRKTVFFVDAYPVQGPRPALGVEIVVRVCKDNHERRHILARVREFGCPHGVPNLASPVY